MNQKLATQLKEDLLEILGWCNDQNRELALHCISEIAEQSLTVLNDLPEGYRETTKECAGSCENCECSDLGSSVQETKE